MLLYSDTFYVYVYKTKKPRREDFLKRLVSIFSYLSLDDLRVAGRI